MNEDRLTLKLPTTESTHSSSYVPASGQVLKQEATEEIIQRLFVRSLNKLDPAEDGFLVLLVLLSLYDKTLRFQHKLGDEGLKDDSPVFPTIASMLNLDVEKARKFWRTVRNGVAHRAIPKNKGPQYKLVIDGEPVSFKNDTFQINVLALKELLFPYIFQTEVWENDSQASLPVTYLNNHEPEKP